MTMRFQKIIIVTQQETLRERPRIHKLGRILQDLGQPFEIWKVGPEEEREADGMPVRNLMTNAWRHRPAPIRYLAWMVKVWVAAMLERGGRGYFAVGFDSAFPVSLLPFPGLSFDFDNIDNVAMSYRWPRLLKAVFTGFERWVVFRAEVHTNPSSHRWPYGGDNLRVVVNTPARKAVEAAQALAQERGYRRGGGPFTLYVNGWLSPTRGLSALLPALDLLRGRGVPVRVIVAGRPACPDADTLVALPGVEHLGMLPNHEALARYYEADLAFIYYDPSIEINRLAESQKWTDCWATATPFVSNDGIETLSKFQEAGACYTRPYDDAKGLADLIEHLAAHREEARAMGERLGGMAFQFWDEKMREVVLEWAG